MLDALRRALRREAPEGPPVAPGLHHFTREVDGAPVRYHLRVERDGAGLVLANASAAVRLSPSGVIIAHHLLGRGMGELGIVRALASLFAAPEARLQKDVATVRAALDELARPHGRYPLSSLDDPEATVHRRALIAPLCADLVVTDAEQALPLLRRLWDVAVPQVILVPAPDLPGRALVPLVERAEDLGLIAGVRARASTLSRHGLVTALAQAGVDHVDVYYASADGSVHDELFGNGDHAAAEEVMGAAREAEVCPTAVVPLLDSTIDEFGETGERLRRLGVPSVTVYALGVRGEDVDEALADVRQAAVIAEEVADRLDLNLVWAPPVERDHAVPLGEQVRQGPRTGSEASVRVEDGQVIPPSGEPDGTGELTGPWDAIWSHPRFTAFREAVDDAPRCDRCPEIAACSAGCVADPSTWSRTGGEG